VTVDLPAGRTAVLVLDVQVLFAAPDGPFANAGAGPMIEAINTLLDVARGAGHPVVHSRYVLRDDLRDAGLLATRGLDLRPFRRSDPLAALDPRVDVASGDLHGEHHRPSAFFASDLDAVLRSLAVDRLVLCGLSVNNARRGDGAGTRSPGTCPVSSYGRRRPQRPSSPRTTWPRRSARWPCGPRRSRPLPTSSSGCGDVADDG
jgi:hypothetical protein